ncbi:hypothetical protein DPX16_4165 [Anabarilius grahami]|uniref:Uncharacterized protein n=1 Tax=Anabarilius grahami TaxID=495550 RepID=A0A3N0XZP2_ANAGA|nr:hypothetical protein DPX16_4165 [Anabarilius grahami]
MRNTMRQERLPDSRLLNIGWASVRSALKTIPVLSPVKTQASSHASPQAALPESRFKMVIALPESLPKMAAIPESCSIMAAIPESRLVMAARGLFEIVGRCRQLYELSLHGRHDKHQHAQQQLNPMEQHCVTGLLGQHLVGGGQTGRQHDLTLYELSLHGRHDKRQHAQQQLNPMEQHCVTGLLGQHLVGGGRTGRQHDLTERVIAEYGCVEEQRWFFGDSDEKIGERRSEAQEEYHPDDPHGACHCADVAVMEGEAVLFKRSSHSHTQDV